MEDIIRFLLFSAELILLALAILHILRRRLPLFDALAWLLLSLFVPIVGPFITIAFLPHKKKTSNPVV
ncbi:MAG: hypothetical protein BGO78_06235 [Chloroflexi bacterium 44-23]|nr:MAG: hypothetical protein BGO78_06235 [Chloroflexi bacterium 44-23]